MNHLDKKTLGKLNWLFIPLVIVGMIIMAFLLFDINIFKLWFGIDVDIIAWSKPALLLSLFFIFLGYSIISIKKKCWVDLVIGIIFILFLLLRVGDFVN